MSAFEVCSFHDSNNNTIKYLFNPSKRLNNSDEGPILLDQVIETFDTAPASPIPQPKAGTRLVEYKARDGAYVGYQYDPTAQNGKQYVVAIHREPMNWQNLREEDLSIENEEDLRRSFEEGPLLNGAKKEPVVERRDSAMDTDPDE